MSDIGFVYLLSNPAMPDIYKIGMSERSPFIRCRELSSSTSCPIPFKVEAYIEVNDPYDVEDYLHQEFSEYRLSSNREFFRIDPFKVVYEMWLSCTYGYFLSPEMRSRYDLSDDFLDLDAALNLKEAGDSSKRISVIKAVKNGQQ